jgi:hypothetical protein
MSKQEILKNYDNVPFTEEEKGMLQKDFVGPIKVIGIAWRVFKENLVRAFIMPYLFQLLVVFGFLFVAFILLVLFFIMIGASAMGIESSSSPEQIVGTLGVSALIFSLLFLFLYFAVIFFVLYFSLKQIYLLNNEACEGVLKTPNVFYGKTFTSIVSTIIVAFIISIGLFPFLILIFGMIFSFVSESLIIGLVLLLLSILYFIIFMIFTNLFNYYTYLIVIEGKGIIESISESYKVVKPYLLREFVRVFIASLLISIPNIVFSFIQSYVSSLNETSPSAGLTIILLILIPFSIVITFITSSVILSAQYTSFYNLRQLSLK